MPNFRDFIIKKYENDPEVLNFLLTPQIRSFNATVPMTIEENILDIARRALGGIDPVQAERFCPKIDGQNFYEAAAIQGFGDPHARLDISFRLWCIHHIIDKELNCVINGQKVVLVLGDIIRQKDCTS